LNESLRDRRSRHHHHATLRVRTQVFVVEAVRPSSGTWDSQPASLPQKGVKVEKISKRQNGTKSTKDSAMFLDL